MTFNPSSINPSKIIPAAAALHRWVYLLTLLRIRIPRQAVPGMARL